MGSLVGRRAGGLAAGGEALARWAGQVEAPGHDAGAGLPLRTCCRQARRVCEPVTLTLPLTPTPRKKVTFANKVSIGGQSHRNHLSMIFFKKFLYFGP